MDAQTYLRHEGFALLLLAALAYSLPDPWGFRLVALMLAGYIATHPASVTAIANGFQWLERQTVFA